jgi:hypothetical protein
MDSLDLAQDRRRFETHKTRMLLLSLLFDGIGMLSYAFPVFGELADVAWAPISGIIYFMMYRGALGVMGGLFSTAEELVPLTDAVPTFTLTWLYMYMLNGERTYAAYAGNRAKPVLRA